jgi:hypothetical protein
MKKIASILHAPGEMQNIFLKTKWLQELGQRLATYLPENLRDHCSVLNYHQNILTLQTKNGSVATILRYQIPELLNALRTRGNLPALIRIECVVSPENSTAFKSKALPSIKLSKAASEILLETAKHISNEQLAEALKKLSENS